MSSAQELHKIANRMRADVLEMVYRASAGHVAGPLSSADLFAVLYFGGSVDWTQDKVILSCGHYCPIQYSALAHAGYFPTEELKTFMVAGSRLPGHPERGSVPGIEVSTGPLGQGVSVATGMALGIKLKGERGGKVFCVISDGELQEGQVWEAFNFAAARQLDNLIFVLDRNKIQIEHYVSEIVNNGEIPGRLEAFGLHVFETNGNDIELLRKTIEKAREVIGAPAMIIMDTVAGKGVSFMENKPVWHDKVPTKQELQAALEELGVSDE